MREREGWYIWVRERGVCVAMGVISNKGGERRRRRRRRRGFGQRAEMDIGALLVRWDAHDPWGWMRNDARGQTCNINLCEEKASRSKSGHVMFLHLFRFLYFITSINPLSRLLRATTTTIYPGAQLRAGLRLFLMKNLYSVCLLLRLAIFSTIGSRAAPRRTLHKTQSHGQECKWKILLCTYCRYIRLRSSYNEITQLILTFFQIYNLSV